MQRLLPSAALLILVSLVQPAAGGETWPQFRGPGGQGHSDAQGLPVTWSATEHVAWKTAIPGAGWSSPVIEGGQVWLTTAVEQGHSLRAVCIDRATGQLLRDVEIFQPAQPLPINDKNSHASPTPVIENGRLWMSFGSMGAACLDTKTGRVLWKNQQYKTDHKEGPGSSPVRYRDLLLLNYDGRDLRFCVALNKDNGRLAWKQDRSAPASDNYEMNKAYATGLIVAAASGDVFVNPGARRVSAYEPSSGRELWYVNYNGFSNVARPVAGHGMVYVCSGFPRGKLLGIRLGGHGDVTDSHVAWSYDRQVARIPSPLLVGGELYMVSDRGVATCLDALTGQEHWTHRLGGNYSASPLLADGRIHFFSEEGVATVIAPGKTYQELAQNQLPGPLLATPAIAGKAFFIRAGGHLFRVEK